MAFDDRWHFEQNYVSQQKGWSISFFALVFAALIGLGIRFYFSNERVTAWLKSEMSKQNLPVELNFTQARLSLSDSGLPQLAVRVSGVRARDRRSCVDRDGVTVNEVTIPVHLTHLILERRFSLGLIYGDEIVVDLDALRDRCAQVTAEVSPPAKPTSEVALIRDWYSPAALQRIQKLLKGVSFSRLRLKIENASKVLDFESLLVRSALGSDSVSVSADLRLSPELVWGQVLTPFAIEVLVKPRMADLEVRGQLGEGQVTGLANVTAAAGDVSVDAHLSLNSVPLNALKPLLVATRQFGDLARFQPRSTWLTCELSVMGLARQLFEKNPIVVEDCLLNGSAGQVRVGRTAIGPNGKLSPVRVGFQDVDVLKFSEMFSLSAPKGIFSEFGLLTGQLEISSIEEMSLQATIRSAKLRFSRGGIRAAQIIDAIGLKLRRSAQGWFAQIQEVQLAEGRYQGLIELETDSAFSTGLLRVAVDDLAFAPAVQKLMVNGQWEKIKISGQAKIEAGQLGRFLAEVSMKGLKTEDLLIAEIDGRLRILDRQGELDLNIPKGELRRDSKIFRTLTPIFMGHAMTEEWIPFQDAQGSLRLVERSLSWERTRALLRGGQIWISSVGGLDPSDEFFGWIGVDFPKLKKMRWNLSGPWRDVRLKPNDFTLSQQRQGPLNDRSLGIYWKNRNADPITDEIVQKSSHD